MNVLFILPYCYIAAKKVGWNTGFGIYTAQLAEYLGKRDNVNVFVLNLRQRFKEDFVSNGVTYIGFNDVKIVKSLFKAGSLKSIMSIKKYNYYKQSETKKLLIASYVVGKGNCLAEIIKKYKIDFVHIHSLAQELYGIFNSKFIRSSNTLVTVHSTYIDDPKYGSYNVYFANMVNLLLEKGINMSFVSSGVRNEFLKRIKCSKDPSELMHVVLNGTRMNPYKREKNDIENGTKNKKKKVLLCVGTICERKNQMQLLEAMKLLSKEERERFVVYVIGEDSTEGKFDNLIAGYGLTGTVIKKGFVSPDEITQYYKIADGNLVLSKREAFGLSIIEAFQYGVPTLCFKDISAANDLYNDCAMLFFDNRLINSVVKGIRSFLSKTWDCSAVREWGENFQLTNIVNQYYNLYKKIQESSHV